MKFGFLGCLLLAGACSMSRPEGAYEPEPIVEDDDTDDDDAPLTRDAGARDARVIPRPDTGAARPPKDAASDTAPDGDDASEEQPTATHPLDVLTGRYLMRMDIYSDVAATRPIALNLHNRLSNVYLVDIERDGEALVSHESLCDQIYEHQCVKGCTNWQTLVSQQAVDKFFDMTPATRRYTFDEASGKLSSDKTTVALGYTENTTTNLPREKSDPRLWKFDKGWGVYTEFSATIMTIGNPKLNCQVSSVQHFVTSIAGTLPKERTLEGVEFTLDTDDTDGAVIDVTGTPTTQCTTEQFEGQQPLNEVSKVHFKRYEGVGCPADFDREFPPKVRFIE